MGALKFQHPLRWPDGRAHSLGFDPALGSGFDPRMTFDDAFTFLEEELKELGIKSAILHSNYDSIADERKRNRVGMSSGVSLEFNFGGREYLIPCDRWKLAQHNIYTLHLVLRHFRVIDRWAVAPFGQLIDIFRMAVVAPPAQQSTLNGNESWLRELGLGPSATLEDANATYRARAKLVANDENKLRALNAAVEAARKVLK